MSTVNTMKNNVRLILINSGGDVKFLEVLNWPEKFFFFEKQVKMTSEIYIASIVNDSLQSEYIVKKIPESESRVMFVKFYLLLILVQPHNKN